MLCHTQSKSLVAMSIVPSSDWIAATVTWVMEKGREKQVQHFM
jgi:hypothetical protein